MPTTKQASTRKGARKGAPKRARQPARTAAKKTKKRARQAARTTVKTARRPARKTAAKPARKPTRKTARKTARKPARKTARTTRPAGAADAIALLKQDHRDVERLFKRFERAGERAFRSKRELVDSIIEELSRHGEVEELVFYPAVRAEVDDAESDVLEAIEEHHVVKLVLRELEDMDATDERFEPKVTVMIENVRHHVKEEERELFPDVREHLGRKRLVELGEALRAAKSRVPTRPHPYAPDEPPGNVLLGPAVAALDRARTVGKRAVDRVREEVPAP
jgi:hemerythrin-like domain-containing protein